MKQRDDLAIVVQGNIRAPIELVDLAWKDYNVIWSTWVDQKINTSNSVVYSEYPSIAGVGNIGLQKTTTYQGLLFAKSVGFKRAVKWRSDQYPTNASMFLDLMDNNALNVLYWHNHAQGYYVDYFMEGDIDLLIDLWNFDNYTNCPYPEYIITDRILQLQSNVNCIGEYLNDYNDVIWLNINKTVATYKSDGLFETRNIYKYE